MAYGYLYVISAIFYSCKWGQLLGCPFLDGENPFKEETTLKGKNLHLEEQILSFKSNFTEKGGKNEIT